MTDPLATVAAVAADAEQAKTDATSLYEKLKAAALADVTMVKSEVITDADLLWHTKGLEVFTLVVFIAGLALGHLF